jgi:hypothetical protein
VYPWSAVSGPLVGQCTSRPVGVDQQLSAGLRLLGQLQLGPGLLAPLGPFGAVLQGQVLDQEHAASALLLGADRAGARQGRRAVVDLDQGPPQARVDVQADGEHCPLRVPDRVGHQLRGDHLDGVPGAVVQPDAPADDLGPDPVPGLRHGGRVADHDDGGAVHGHGEEPFGAGQGNQRPAPGGAGGRKPVSRGGWAPR